MRAAQDRDRNDMSVSYYQVAHLEPWERGSRKTSGQTGMCGGVRGVGAGGIVSSAYCLLFKLFTLRYDAHFPQSN